jgi:hypothetical protein
MQQPTSRQLYAYWDTIRNGRIAPRRFEIEPAKIAGLLRKTFIAECTGLLAFRFRLAGTRVCQQFGRELRGVDFLSLWPVHDRDAIGSLVRNIVNDGAVGHGLFLARTETNRQVAFEFTLMPLIHTGSSINRILGSITAIEPPFWLGGEPLTTFEATELHCIGRTGFPPSWATTAPRSSASSADSFAWSMTAGCWTCP